MLSVTDRRTTGLRHTAQQHERLNIILLTSEEKKIPRLSPAAIPDNAVRTVRSALSQQQLGYLFNVASVLINIICFDR